MELKEEFKWINELKDQGYQYMIMKPRSKSVVYATKCDQLKNGSFRANSLFDEFQLDKENESWIPGHDTRGVFIRL